MTGKIITFYLGGILFGINIADVKEVGRKAKYTPVPGVKYCIAGLMNMRGQVVTLFDIKRIMKLEQDNKITHSSYIILKTGHKDNGYAGFLVDKLCDVIDIQNDWCETPTDGICSSIENFVQELVKLKDRLAVIIDCDRILNECLGK